MAERKSGFFPMLAVVLAAAGLIVPIIWDRYQTKSALDIRLESAAVIVEAPEDVTQLQVVYNGRPVQRLTRLVFTIENTGRRPIRETDLVMRPTFQVPAPGELLDMAPGPSDPPELKLTTELCQDRQLAQIGFSLLNPGDKSSFSILTSGTPDDIRASARVAGVPRITIRRVGTSDGGQGSLSWTFYVTTAATLFSWFVFLVSLHALGGESAVAKLPDKVVMLIPYFNTPSEYDLFLRTSFPNKTAEFSRLRHYLASLPREGNFTDEQRDEIQRLFIAALSNARSMKTGTAIFGALSLVGTWYVLSQWIL